MGTHEFTCECGRLNIIPCFTKRHNRSGDGYHNSGEVSKLSALMVKIVDVLDKRYSWENGLTSWGVYTEVKKLYRPDERCPMLNTIRARLSTMAGDELRIVRVEKNQLEQLNQATQEYGYKKQQRWFLNPNPTLNGIRLLDEARERAKLPRQVLA